MRREYDVTGNDATADGVVVLRGSTEHESVMGVNVAGGVKEREGKGDDTETVGSTVGVRKKKKNNTKL
jgi:hypothetical protein